MRINMPHSITLKICIGLFLCLLTPSILFGQEPSMPEIDKEPKPTKVPNKDRYYRFILRSNGGIPTPTYNKAFRKVFNGTMDINFQPCFNIYEGIFIGLSSKYLLLKVLPSRYALVSTEMHLANAGLVMGFEHQMDNNSMWCVAFSGGHNWLKYTKIQPPDEQLELYAKDKFTAYNFEASVGYYFYAEENFAIGGHLAYNALYNTFNPNNIYLDKYLTFEPGDYKGYTQYICFGFGVYYGIGKRKKA